MSLSDVKGALQAIKKSFRPLTYDPEKELRNALINFGLRLGLMPDETKKLIAEA